MAIQSLATEITLDAYLASTFRPDCDFVDGHLEERNLGQFDHARIQALLAAWFINRENEWNIKTVVEQRVQASPSRFRIPDVCVLRGGQPKVQIIREAPLICIEVLSPDDSIQSMRTRIADYLQMGVEHIWLIDPESGEGLVCTDTSWSEVRDGRFEVPNTEIFVPLYDIIANL
jgi:Uma2 family endonuclease